MLNNSLAEVSMRAISSWFGRGYPPLASLLALSALALPVGAQEPHDAKHAENPPTVIATDSHHDTKTFNLADAKKRDEFFNEMISGHLEHAEVQRPMENPMKIAAEVGIWTIVVFILLLLILRKAAWGPILEGLHKREETIKNAVEEAKQARADTQRVTAEFQVKMDQAYAEIPKIMAQARREAEAFKEEMRAQTAKDIQIERQRLRREIETARDQALQELWNQAAQLATLISAKAIGRSLTEEDHRRLLDEAIVELGQAAGRG
jgi:F-type H+-transporting ATPase subunit b